MALLIGLMWFSALVYVNVKGVQARSWHAQRGEREGRAEYARLVRERPDAPEARLSEAEFVNQFVASKPSPWRYHVAAVALVIVGIPLLGFVAVAFRH